VSVPVLPPALPIRGDRVLAADQVGCPAGGVLWTAVMSRPRGAGEQGTEAVIAHA